MDDEDDSLAAPRRSIPLDATRLTGVELRRGCGDRFRPMLVPQFCLLWPDDDGGTLGPGLQAFERVRAGELLLRAPGQILPHVGANGGSGAACRALLLDPGLLRRTAEEPIRGLAPFHSLCSDDAELAATARAVWDAVELKLPLREQQAVASRFIGSVRREIAGRPASTPRLRPAVARARDLLHQRFREELKLDEVARAVAMSKCHLVHLFHEQIGMPPHAYQIQLRVAYARQLVDRGVPLGTVASLAGFADQSHLTRMFKRIVGISPGRYAQREQQAVEVETHEPVIATG